MDSVNRTLTAVDTYATLADRARIKLAVTEFAPLDWSPTNKWPNVNDLGHALVTFDMLGALELHPRVLFSQYWVTRWMDWGLNALTPRNCLTPVGQALAIWGQSLGVKLNLVYRDASVIAWLTEKSNGSRVLLVRNHSNTPVSVTLQNMPTGPAERKVFTGSGPTDLEPTYNTVSAAVNGQMTMPPYSITVLTMVK
jgi:alpha-N-arabinofuranosidase